MRWALFLVVCEVHSYRPEPQAILELEPLEPCRRVEAPELCGLHLKDGECFTVEPGGYLQGKCRLEGPLEGMVHLHGAHGASLHHKQRRQEVKIRGGISFHGLRLEAQGLRLASARLNFYSTSGQDGGAVHVGAGGLRMINSSLKVQGASGQNGGAVWVHRRNQLTLEHSELVVEDCNASLDGGAIWARNVRLQDSRLHLARTFARDGGGLRSEMLVARNSSLTLRETRAWRHGGGSYSAKRLVLMSSTLSIRGASVPTLASKGGGVFTFLAELRNATVEMEDAFSGEKGGCIHVAKHLRLESSRVYLNGCRSQSRGAVHVGQLLELHKSTMRLLNSSMQSSAMHVDQVRLWNSSLELQDLQAEVPPVALDVTDLQMKGSSMSLQGQGGHDGLAAIEVSTYGLSMQDARCSFNMSDDSQLLMSGFFSGIFATDGVVRLRGASLRGMASAVEMSKAELLDVAGVELDVNAVAFACDECQSVSLRNVSGRVGALLRATQLSNWSLSHVKASCQRPEVACVQLESVPSFIDPVPWHLEVDLASQGLKNNSPVLLQLEGPQVAGSQSRLNATCPPGSFSFIQESVSTVYQAAELLNMWDEVRGPGEATCCASTKTLPRKAQFFNRSFDYDFGLIPEMNVSCDPSVYPCVCTTSLCDRQMLKTSMVSSRVSCMSCPMGHYSLNAFRRRLEGGRTGLLGSSGIQPGDCVDCSGVAAKVGKTPLCAGGSVRVPRGIMTLPGEHCNAVGLCFYRCPNAGACPGGEMASEAAHCAPGYAETSPGCSMCAEGFGRQNVDPFECGPCGRWDFSLAYFCLLPVVPVLLAVRSASQTEKERMSMVIKVNLSFGTFIATVQNILEQTETSQHVQRELKLAMGVLHLESGDEGSAASSLLSASFDCLVGGRTTRWQHLLLQSSHFLVFSLVFFALDLMTKNPFQATWARRNIVLGNAFLAPIFGAFLQWTPCFHMSNHPDGSFPSFSVYQADEVCGSSMGLLMPVLGLFLFMLLGPVYWLCMVWRSKRWRDRKDYIGFLIAGYEERCEWWEITVLVRKSFLVGALVLVPVSYAPMSLVIVTALVMLAALVGHLVMRPYVDPMMNYMEGAVLTYCMLALLPTLYLMAKSWTSTSKTLVFVLLTCSNAVVCLVLLLVFLVTALRAKEKS